MRFDLFLYGGIDICGSSIYMYAVQFIFARFNLFFAVLILSEWVSLYLCAFNIGWTRFEDFVHNGTPYNTLCTLIIKSFWKSPVLLWCFACFIKPLFICSFEILFCEHFINIIIRHTHYEKSDWSRAFNQFTIACELDMVNAISAAQQILHLSCQVQRLPGY